MVVVKKDGVTREPFDKSKIIGAVTKAQVKVGYADNTLASTVVAKILPELWSSGGEVGVQDIHVLVEDALMDLSHEVAREYITYRKVHAPDIFKTREDILPYEYPEVLPFIQAIRQSHWIHDEYNYAQDVTDYLNPNVPSSYKISYARCLLAISQIEVAVKSYWKTIDTVFPKHEFSMLAGTFDESECRHFDTYRNLLELLGLNEMFSNLDSSPVLKARSEALRSSIYVPTKSKKDVLLKNIMFSSFIENVSLYGQFLLLMAFSKSASLFKGTANGVESTSVEEVTHFLAGTTISNIIIRENPELWDDSLKAEVLERASLGLKEEYALIDWICDGRDLPFISRDQLKKFIAIRMHESLEPLGLTLLEPKVLKDAKEDTKEFNWFADKQTLITQGDFFAGRETAYSKGTRSFTGEDLYSEEFYKIMGDLNAVV